MPVTPKVDLDELIALFKAYDKDEQARDHHTGLPLPIVHVYSHGTGAPNLPVAILGIFMLCFSTVTALLKLKECQRDPATSNSSLAIIYGTLSIFSSVSATAAIIVLGLRISEHVAPGWAGVLTYIIVWLALFGISLVLAVGLGTWESEPCASCSQAVHQLPLKIDARTLLSSAEHQDHGVLAPLRFVGGAMAMMLGKDCDSWGAIYCRIQC